MRGDNAENECSKTFMCCANDAAVHGGMYALPGRRPAFYTLRPHSTDQYIYADGHFRMMPGEGDFAFAQVLNLTEEVDGFRIGLVAVYRAGSAFTGDVHGTPEAWQKTDPESMPALDAIYRVKVSVSPRDSRFILREYIKGQAE